MSARLQPFSRFSGRTCSCLFLLLEVACIPWFVAPLYPQSCQWLVKSLSHLITWTLTLLPSLWFHCALVDYPGQSPWLWLFQSQQISNLNSIYNCNSPIFSLAMCISVLERGRCVCMCICRVGTYIKRDLRNWFIWLWRLDSTNSEVDHLVGDTGKSWCSRSSLKVEVSPRGDQSFVLFRLSTDWLRSTHIREGNLPYSKSTCLNVNLIPKPSQKHPEYV